MSGAPPRIALLHGFDWSEVRRGTERLVAELAPRLAARGHDVTVISAHSGRRRVEERGGAAVILNRRPPLPGAAGRHALGHIPRSRREARGGDFSLLCAFHPADALAALGRRGSAPVVFSVPAYPPERAGPLRRAALAQVYRRVAAIVAPTRAVAAEFGAVAAGTSVEVIAPGVDLTAFTPGAARAAEPTVFCAADLVEPRKRVEALVRAFSVARGEVPDARLVLANPYPGRPLPGWTQAAGVEVRPTGGDGALRDAYREAWVSVLPAVREPFGLVLAEAMACGTPVIGARADGIPEVIGDGPQGRLVDPHDLPGWAAALREGLAGPPSPAASAAGRRRAEELSMDRCADSYDRLFRELAARAQSATSAGGGISTG